MVEAREEERGVDIPEDATSQQNEDMSFEEEKKDMTMPEEEKKSN